MAIQSKDLNNPFVLAGYYSKRYFCDRELEFAQLADHINNERNVVLFAWRRLGKTALINYYLHEQELAGNTETIYVDLLSTRTMTEAINQLSLAVFNKFGKTKSGFANVLQLLGKLGISASIDPLTALPSFQLGLQQNVNPPQNLQEIGAFLATQNKRIIVAIDEFQQVASYDDAHGEAVFRAWTQQFPAIRFIFSGSQRNLMTAMFAEKNRPFYRSAQLLPLNAIPLSAYTPFIKHHFSQAEKTITDAQIADLYTWSNGQTYSIQLICNRLFGSFTEVTMDALKQVYADILQQESAIFSNVATLLTKAQWQLLVALAKEDAVKNPLSKDFLKKHNLGASSTVNTALKKLTETELVVRTEEHYQVHDILLSRWLQQR